MAEINFELMKPVVSIVVATYRRDFALERALLSLTSQTYDSLEIIVVDDNADKEWNNKIEKIVKGVECQSGLRLIYIRNEKNRGSAETRNNGIKRASGEFITFLDDDDIYLPNKIKNQVEHMLDSKSDYSLTDLYLYDESDRLIEKRNRNYIKKYTKDDLLRYHLMHHMTGTDSMMFKKDYLLNIGVFPPISVGDEFYLMQKAIEANGKFSYLPICDVIAYVHTETEGLSSGECKIKGENALYDHKKKYFHLLGSKSIPYVRMRHYAVLAFAEYRRNNIAYFIKYSIYSFLSNPLQSIKLIFERKFN